MTLNLLRFTNIYNMLQRMNMWFSSTWLEGVQTVTRVKNSVTVKCSPIILIIVSIILVIK